MPSEYGRYELAIPLPLWTVSKTVYNAAGKQWPVVPAGDTKPRAASIQQHRLSVVNVFSLGRCGMRSNLCHVGSLYFVREPNKTTNGNKDEIYI
mmetsp:Transcript_4359/g.6749  ORF Transcript_4359/g.6749 Transcript_4359/m.6749 type:complete len:94 (+) Transcript_4359:930-1211(+)